MNVVPLDFRPEDQEGQAASRIAVELDLDLLRTLVVIADTGNFYKAARAMFRTPSAISLQMKKLEEQIGRTLFMKDGRTVALTPDGEVLVGYGRRIVRLAEEALSRFGPRELEGSIRFGMPDEYSVYFLPKILARLAATHPKVGMEVFCMPSRELLARLDDNMIDMAIVTAGQGHQSGPIIHREPLVWTGVRGGSAHLQRPIILAVSSMTCIWRRAAMDALDRVGISHRTAYASSDYMGQLAAVVAGLALAIFPRSAVGGELAVVGESSGLPSLGHCEIELRHSLSASGPLFDALAEQVVNTFRESGRAH
jgi:DNA-binding transcriptional LysR family regulator